MFGAGAIMVAAALLAPAVAVADAEDKPVVVNPGVYVVSSCGILGYGSNEAEARRGFQQAARKARRDWRTMPRRCALTSLTDVIRIAPGQAPAFFVTGSTLVKGRDPDETVRRCRQEEEAAARAQPDLYRVGDGRCDRVRAAYGPFKRKPGWDEYDDARAYVYLNDRGEWIDDTGNSICFPAGTPIATPDGDRSIEALAAGSHVLSWSAERGATVAARVLAVKRRRAHDLLELVLADGRTLRVSANHPLFVPERDDWVAAGALRPGDQLGVLAGDHLVPVPIEQIADLPGDVDVFDLTIETTHAYFARGVLAHNY